MNTFYVVLATVVLIVIVLLVTTARNKKYAREDIKQKLDELSSQDMVGEIPKTFGIIIHRMQKYDVTPQDLELRSYSQIYELANKRIRQELAAARLQRDRHLKNHEQGEYEYCETVF